MRRHATAPIGQSTARPPIATATERFYRAHRKDPTMQNQLEQMWKEADEAWDRNPRGAEWLYWMRRICAFWSTCIGQG